MAEPVAPTAPGAIVVLEETAQLLRQCPFSTLLCHWVGSLPFAMGVLMFWNNLTNSRLTDQACARQALVLALLLVWMNCWRAISAGRMRRQLSGTPNPPWTWTRAANLIASQSFLGAARLVVLPLAALVCFPFAAAVAFFRNSAALADRTDLDPLQLISKARALSQVDQRQSWIVLPVLTLLQLVLAANLALVYAVLPFLVRMLTGVESDFSRGTAFYVENPLFIVLVLVSGWAAFDPFVQALYCVRCFHGESVATGEDLRVSLRRIQAAKVLAAFVLLAVLPLRAADAVSPKELEDSVHRAMQAPEYNWRIPPPPDTGITGKPWVVQASGKILEALNSAWRALGKALGKLFDWIFGGQLNTPVPGEGAAPKTGLNRSLWVLLVLVAAAAVWIVWRRGLLRRKRAPGGGVAVTAPVRLDEEGVTADQLPEERWMELALECLREEKYRLALRAYYLASLAWLGTRGFIAIHAGKTNREYELELRRKARQFAEARALFGANISAFEAAWYGMHEVSGEGVAEFRQRLDGMKKVMA